MRLQAPPVRESDAPDARTIAVVVWVVLVLVLYLRELLQVVLG